MYPRPHLFPRKFTAILLAPEIHVSFNLSYSPLLVFPNALSNPPESVCHKSGGSEKVHGRPEAASGEIALVLNGAIAARRRHILRHGGRVCGGVQLRMEWWWVVVRLRSSLEAGVALGEALVTKR